MKAARKEPVEMNISELYDTYQKQEGELKAAKELIGWIRDITHDYEAKSREGLEAIRILINGHGKRGNNGKRN